MKEVIIRLKSDHIKVKGAEYVRDLVRCKDCGKTEERSTRFDNEKYCSVMVGWVDDNFYCGYGEVLEAIPSADRPQLDKDIVEPIGNGNVIMSEDTYEDLLDRPQGEWKPFDLTWGRSIYACSVCEEAIAVPCGWSDGKPIYDYCPNCGARMKGADDE